MTARDWLSRFPGPTIVVVAPADEVYRRGGQRNSNRTLEQFKEVEYSPYRQSLYNAAKYQCCVAGLSVQEGRSRFVELISKLIEQMGQVGVGTL